MTCNDRVSGTHRFSMTNSMTCIDALHDSPRAEWLGLPDRGDATAVDSAEGQSSPISTNYRRLQACSAMNVSSRCNASWSR